MGSDHSESPLLSYFCLLYLISSKTHQTLIALHSSNQITPQKHMTLVQISNQKPITLVHNNNENALTHPSRIRLHGNKSLYRAQFNIMRLHTQIIQLWKHCKRTSGFSPMHVLLPKQTHFHSSLLNKPIDTDKWN